MTDTPFTPEELDAGQLVYLAWAKANKEKAFARCRFRNSWLRKHGRKRHCIPPGQIKLL